MKEILHVLLHSAKDTVKLFPFLFLIYFDNLYLPKIKIPLAAPKVQKPKCAKNKELAAPILLEYQSVKPIVAIILTTPTTHHKFCTHTFISFLLK